MEQRSRARNLVAAKAYGQVSKVEEVGHKDDYRLAVVEVRPCVPPLLQPARVLIGLRTRLKAGLQLGAPPPRREKLLHEASRFRKLLRCGQRLEAPQVHLGTLPERWDGELRQALLGLVKREGRILEVQVVAVVAAERQGAGAVRDPALGRVGACIPVRVGHVSPDAPVLHGEPTPAH